VRADRGVRRSRGRWRNGSCRKALRVAFNEYEYEQLAKGTKLSGRSKLNFMRYAMLKLSKELQEEDA